MRFKCALIILILFTFLYKKIENTPPKSARDWSPYSFVKDPVTETYSQGALITTKSMLLPVRNGQIVERPQDRLIHEQRAMAKN
jgi:hypothetical protein